MRLRELQIVEIIWEEMKTKSDFQGGKCWGLYEKFVK